MHILNSLVFSPASRAWWIFLALLCVFLEVVALYYQYQLNYLPCVLCVHIRMLLAGLLLVSILALILPKNKWVGLILLVLATVLWLWMLERSWNVLGVEMGFIMGDCEMSSGLPAWFPLESWFPSIFKIHEPCGYTPYIFFKVSMAHILLALSAFFSLSFLVSLYQTTRKCLS